ncbi:MAG: hypothetical protein ACRERE_04885 [Candidatus Entotheonellia bacterium]
MSTSDRLFQNERDVSSPRTLASVRLCHATDRTMLLAHHPALEIANAG